MSVTEPLTYAALRGRLRRLHAKAEAGIVPGLDYAEWYRVFGDPPLRLRVEQWCAVSLGRDPLLWRAHARLKAEFYERENVLLARAWAAADPTPRNRTELAIAEARQSEPRRDIAPASYWPAGKIAHVAAGGMSSEGITLAGQDFI